MERTTSWDQGQKNRAFENASEQHHREVQESMTDGRTLLDIIDGAFMLRARVHGTNG